VPGLGRGRVAVAAAVKVPRAEAIAATAPQQRKALPAELGEECRKVCNDWGSEAVSLGFQRPNLSSVLSDCGRRGRWARALEGWRGLLAKGGADGLDRGRQPRDR
jgi:hypothetical protein